MNLYIRELKKNSKSLIIFIISTIAFTAAGMGKYASFAEQGELIDELMSSMPKAMLQALSLDVLNLSKILDFFAYMVIYTMMIAGIYAIKLGINILLKEESDKTIEFLATKPIKRSCIITSKILAAITNLAIYDISIIIFSYLLLEVIKIEDYDTGALFIFLVTIFVFEVLYFSIGLGLSSILKNSKKSTSISLGVVFLGYMLSIVTGLSEDLEFIKYITPFKYFDGIYIIREGFPEPIYFIISFIVIVMCVVFTFFNYNKKDFSV